MANVTMSMEEHEALKKQLEGASSLVAKLNEELIEAKQADPTARVQTLTELARTMLPIVQFAMANLAPELIKGWPYRQLEDVAIKLSALPDHSPHDVELGLEMKRFADECREWALKRSLTPEKEIPPPFPVSQHPLVQMRAGQIPEAGPESPETKLPDTV